MFSPYKVSRHRAIAFTPDGNLPRPLLRELKLPRIIGIERALGRNDVCQHALRKEAAFSATRVDRRDVQRIVRMIERRYRLAARGGGICRRSTGIGISNTLSHDFETYPSSAEGASARKFLSPRCFTKFSPLKECDVHPAGTDTRASGRAGSPALAKAHRVKDQAAWNRSTRRAGEHGGVRAGRPMCVTNLTITAGSSMAAMNFRCAPQCGQCSMSMSKTRLSKRAQLMRAGSRVARCLKRPRCV